MKKKVFFLFWISMLVISIQSKSQSFEVPKNYDLKVKEDYVKYEKDVIACANWMEITPLDQESQKWTDANIFILKWLTGSPTVNVNIDADLLIKYFEKNNEFQIIFLAAWTRYSLQNNYSKDQLQGYYEGFKSIITIYKKGTGVKKSKDMEKIASIYDKGELETWLKENIKM
jgi:hypothetical protein